MMGRNSATPALIMFVMGIIGLLAAAVEQIAYDQEFVITKAVEAGELPGLQIITIVMFLIFGAVLAALNSK